MTRSGESLPVQRSSGRESHGPFSMMRRFGEEMDRLFESFWGLGRRQWPDWSESFGQVTRWPQVEVTREGNKFVVKADIPGLEKEDVKVELRDDELCISGERREESERAEGGYYRSERSYGSFCRVVALPQGAKPETASASFENGVLRVEMEAPSEAARGRRIEVR